MNTKSTLQRIREELSVMTLFEKFEQITAIILGFLISLIIVISLFHLIVGMIPEILGGSFNPLAPKEFYKLFGLIMTVLIAMEFKHSIIRVALRKGSIIQVNTVILIAILAIGRKFIILDISKTDAASIAALSFGILSLGVVYWLMRERDNQLR
jgi:uncharacterized membrane protein (DUF373 family)